jgi:hypothetical protein
MVWLSCNGSTLPQFLLKNQNLPSWIFHGPQHLNQTAAILIQLMNPNLNHPKSSMGSNIIWCCKSCSSLVWVLSDVCVKFSRLQDLQLMDPNPNHPKSSMGSYTKWIGVVEKQWFGCHDGWTLPQFWLNKNQNFSSWILHRPQHPNQTAARLTAHGS